ncbi:thymidine phosphorylase family protein [Brevundimonas sp. UBA7534]|uniref:thymidine phosphorylase family protein n=1 Tax=Brevundimonas sp. UBA7534 TaxID=1946138 RepID=UPI0025C103AE|nr:thymidine phosphorylase family protein [Brevundimonas sp. UBA7534]
MTRLSNPSHAAVPSLKARRFGLHAQHESIVLMRRDCPVCRSEGLSSRAQVVLSAGGREVYATLYQMEGDLLGHDEVALSEEAWRLLGVAPGDPVAVRHAPAIESMSSVRRRIYGARLDETAIQGVIRDVAAGRYTSIHLAAFLTATSALPLDEAETVALTRAMVDVGDRLSWAADVVMDKHCIGGLPGNRTTPIVVAILAACGLVAPKTSSRAITSPAGTADTMETLAPVDLDVGAMRRVVEAEGGCVVWGGAVRLSPVDDIFIRIERVLDVDTEGQLIASVLSKKIAAGSTHVVLDLPVGATAKVRSAEAAGALAARLTAVASGFGIRALCLQTDGSQPVGVGIGPALEARDILAVLQNRPGAPADLRARACLLAGAALELAGRAAAGEGVTAAEGVIADGRAWTKFQRICEAQGGMRVPPTAGQRAVIRATRSGRVILVNNRQIATLAKLAGAPERKAAGLEMHVRLGMEVAAGDALATVHAESRGELDYAMVYAASHTDLIEVEG